MKKLYLSLVLIAVPLLFMFGCGDALNDLTTTEIDVNNINMGSFDLAYGGQGLTLTTTSGNPTCGNTSLNMLLDEVSAWADIDESKIDSINLSNVQYQISNNTTEDLVTGSLKMTSHITQQLTDIASVEIGATENVTWTSLNLTTEGESILEHYLNSRNEMFDFCAQGTPDHTSLSMTIEIQAGVVVTVDLL